MSDATVTGNAPISSKDHYETIAMFERIFKGHGRLDKEPKEMWLKGYVYQHGEMNQLFLAFRQGVAYGRSA